MRNPGAVAGRGRGVAQLLVERDQPLESSHGPGVLRSARRAAGPRTRRPAGARLRPPCRAPRGRRRADSGPPRCASGRRAAPSPGSPGPGAGAPRPPRPRLTAEADRTERHEGGAEVGMVRRPTPSGGSPCASRASDSALPRSPSARDSIRQVRQRDGAARVLVAEDLALDAQRFLVERSRVREVPLLLQRIPEVAEAHRHLLVIRTEELAAHLERLLAPRRSHSS